MRLEDLASTLGCELRGDGAVEITGVAALDEAGPGQLTFLADRRHVAKLATTRASAVIVTPSDPELACPTLRAAQPYLAFVGAVELFHPARRPSAGVHPTAVVAPTAVIGSNASIGPYAVVGDGVVVGRDATLHPRVTLYPEVHVGDGFTAHAGVVVREGTRIGDRVTVRAEGHRKIPQVGRVVLEDDVEVGANATVDRAALGETVVGRGTKIDNLVMIAHGCRIGPGCLVAAQSGLAGGTRLGAFVMLGGQVGSAGHLTVGDRAQVAAQSGLHGDVPAGAVYGGYPAVEVKTWRRMMTSLPRLPELLRRLKRVERKLGLTDPDTSHD